MKLDDLIGVAVRGLRLDAALIGLEAGLLSVMALWLRPRLRLVVRILWSVSFVHALACVTNYLFFQERSQHFWEMLLANINQPEQMYIAVAPLFHEQPLLASILSGASLVFLFLGYRLSRSFSVSPVDLAATLGSRRRAYILIVILLALNLEPVTIKRMAKKSELPFGWYPGITASKFYMPWGDYRQNQAVVNPLYDFVTQHLPYSLNRQGKFYLEKPEAVEIARALLRLPNQNSEYPLLREIRSDLSLGIENVILIQVEGLSESFVHQEVDGKAVMPYLRKLSRQSLYFPNMVQSFNATDGSVFSTITGFPETFVDRGAHDFFEFDGGGSYPSISRILGNQGYQHFFFQGFRHRYTDYLRFVRNQGYSAYGLDYFQHRLGDDPANSEAVNVLGVFDDIFLQETASVLIKSSIKFTAHVVTATSHSPWTTPRGFGKQFDHKILNAFHYVDKSIENFVERLRRDLPRFDRTLLVIVADHTGASGADLLNRLHVPLLFYGKGLMAMKDRWVKQSQTWASHIDIVPTILTLMGGRYCYSGMGQSLLNPEALGKGVVSNSRTNGYYLKSNWMFRYQPYSGEMNLYAIGNGQARSRHDLAAKEPKTFEQLKREYFALYETSKYLTREKNLFPENGIDACMRSEFLASSDRSAPHGKEVP